MYDTCPRDWMGFCVVALSGACDSSRGHCQHESKTRRDKLAIIERARQKRLKAILVTNQNRSHN